MPWHFGGDEALTWREIATYEDALQQLRRQMPQQTRGR